MSTSGSNFSVRKVVLLITGWIGSGGRPWQKERFLLLKEVAALAGRLVQHNALINQDKTLEIINNQALTNKLSGTLNNPFHDLNNCSGDPLPNQYNGIQMRCKLTGTADLSGVITVANPVIWPGGTDADQDELWRMVTSGGDVVGGSIARIEEIPVEQPAAAPVTQMAPRNSNFPFSQ
ncbi:hypothetical protein AMATHDRAFT_10957 [Amanita thiersii Skay4041]|uniref:Uncharacterized protein n=1 Tax=Amanita thiersii Skay4041 TaxID=703135 RepID=A0A2A9N6K5_9AGAR|nr:hypothetical protein AMATHDRAFT_10957 [Amanita thiersii Skay4041]